MEDWILKFIPIFILIPHLLIYINLNQLKVDSAYFYYKPFMRKWERVPLDEAKKFESIWLQYYYLELKNGKKIYFMNRYFQTMIDIFFTIDKKSSINDKFMKRIKAKITI